MPQKSKVKSKPKAKEEKAEIAAEDFQQQIDALIKETNKRLETSGSGGKVYRGEQIRYVECERMPSGSISLDVIMGGGLPKSRYVEYYGEYSSGKTTASALAIAANQLLNPKINVLIAAAEGFNKSWWRQLGVYIPYSIQELEDIESETPEKLEKAQEYNAISEDYGHVVVQQIMAGDKLLEEFVRYVRKGIFDFGIVDSIGAIQPSSAVDEDDEKYREIGDDNFGGNAKMLGRFAGKLDACFNSRVITPSNPVGEPNKICIIGINQVRDKIGGFSKYPVPPEATGGHALRHLKHVAVRFSKGQLLKEVSKSENIVYGRTTRVQCTKNKTARPEREGAFNFHFQEHDGVFGVDKALEALEYGTFFDLIVQNGAFYSFNGERIGQGKDNAAQFIRDNPQLLNELTPQILKLAR